MGAKTSSWSVYSTSQQLIQPSGCAWNSHFSSLLVVNPGSLIDLPDESTVYSADGAGFLSNVATDWDGSALVLLSQNSTILKVCGGAERIPLAVLPHSDGHAKTLHTGKASFIVVDNMFQVYRLDGFKASKPIFKFSFPFRPTGIAQDAKGRIYIACVQTSGHVYQITGYNAVIIYTGSVELGEITIDASGNLWVASIAEDTVKMIYNTNQ
jgi:hypothetical protein